MTRTLSCILLSFFIFAATGTTVFADVASDIDKLSAKSTNVKIAAIERLVASGEPVVVAVLTAFLEGNLYARKADGKIIIGKTISGRFTVSDPLAGDDLGAVKKAALDKIRINNRLRTIVRGALGGLTLLSPDKSQRLTAARDVFKSQDIEVITLLEKAIAKETDDAVMVEFRRSLAAVQATNSEDVTVRLAAIKVLSEFTDQDVRALIASLIGREAPAETGAPENLVRTAAENALASIEARLKIWGYVASIFQGLSLGSVLLLAAMGLAITFGVMGVINMAHGEMVMLGAYTTYLVQDLFKTYLATYFDWSILIAIPAAFMVAGLFGVVIERCVIRFLYGRPLETLLATWGISLMLQQLVRSVFGPTNQEVSNPTWMSGTIEVTGGLDLTYNRIWIMVFAVLVFALVTILMKKTAFGLRMRAVTQNRAMASSMGIRTGWVDAMTFGLGSGIAGMAGVALSQIDNVSPNLGQAYIIDSFMVVVFGGVGNLWGTVVGALSLGIFNKFLEPVSGAVLAKILVLVAVILFIQKRPRGLFALKGRAVEG
ncbi:MAG: urea ABC transporter permease subunit UrtB [Rhodospirillales bacterium]|nr:urea ABC transporter permease subunit UrtB [Rhodospirillales bacterium]